MTTTSPDQSLVPCPGCGGQGKFEWPDNPKVPKTWTPAAICAMCQGTGKVPAAWGANSRANH